MTRPIPKLLEKRHEIVKSRLAALDFALPPGIAENAVEVGIASEFVLATLESEPEALAGRLLDPSPLDRAAFERNLALDPADEAGAMRALRRCRSVELARIAWRDLTGAAALEETLADTSRTADALIQIALDYAVARLATASGREPPRAPDGRPWPMLVLGMGKLGGHELNFSSDVDLVFLFPDAAAAARGDDDDEPADAYYVKLAQLLIKLLDKVTADGFVYRVDTRLRPFGQAGPLAMSVSAFEEYLVTHGRDWERYAYVKARLLTGEEHASDVFDEILAPFVYRRYLDYGVFDALRQMKRLIMQQVVLKEMAENIKLGPGGIREIEFIAQAFQLVRGGRDRALRERSLLTVLPRLAGDRQLPEAVTTALTAAYRFLRTLENRLQAFDDRQTHEIPADEEARAILAFALREPGWPALARHIAAQRKVVETEFGRVAWETLEETPASDNASVNAWEAADIAGMLAGTPLAADADSERLLTELRSGGLYERMDETARRRLAAVIARTLAVAGAHATPARALERTLPIYRAVGRRSAYLALLNENPAALERLVDLAARSAWLARELAEHPLLLDELLDARLFDTPPTRAELEALLERMLHDVDRGDSEALIEAIRVFQRTAIFRIAIADRLGALPIMKVSDRLTDTAELVVDLALSTAWRELTAKHGRPLCGPPPREAGFAVIGYGKLGGLELGYGSDLDVVFLHDSAGAEQETDGKPPLDNERFFARLVQRLIHFLTIQTSTGRLYDVDTRLRPSGGSGHIVSSLESFERYQREDAWVWEHQALLRSRALAGSREVCARFEQIRHETLTRYVARDKLKDEVAKMRARMRNELSLGKGRGFDLKQDAGGIADIEFLVDYWVLASSDRYPELIEFPDNMRQLEALERTGLVAAATCRRLAAAYLALRQRVHELALDESQRVVGDTEFASERAFVVATWHEVFGA